MGVEMRVDRDGAREIAEAAKLFDWTWTLSDVERFGAGFGWSEPARSETDGQFELATGLAVERPRARIVGTDGRIDRIVVTIADTLDAEADPGPAVAAAFHRLTLGVWQRWEPPTEWTVLAEFGNGWVFPNVVIGVVPQERSVELWLAAPAERERVSAREQHAITVFTSSEEWRRCAAAISSLAHADPGSWSRAEMEGVLAAIGWPPVTTSEPEALRAKSDSSSLWVTRSDDDDRRYRFGEYRSVRLSHRVPENVLRIAYLTALDLCVRELGAPSFVGGPGALATWRRGPVTVTLSRRLAWLGSGSLELALRPTEATENEDYTWSEYDEQWEPAFRWRVRPDRDADRSDISGMYFPGAPRSRDWDDFEERLDDVFGSLGADLPVLFRFATTIVWVITQETDPGFVAQGWFSGTEARVEVRDASDGEIAFYDFPPGRAGAEQVVALVKAAVRAVVDTPERLRYYAFASSKPQQLWDLRLGLAVDTREAP
ncbi:DUF6301 family protein [Nocardia sp. NPDC050406]|uniref:DUF6301 family protein n=1 Tax=Nocardia sp. NPDC050406 TaxID=3364318 RepID=UPI00379A9FCD